MRSITFREYIIDYLSSMPDNKIIHRTMRTSYTVSQMRVMLAKKEQDGLAWFGELMRMSRDYVARNAGRNTECPSSDTEMKTFKLDSFTTLLKDVPETGPILYKDGHLYKAHDIKQDKSLFVAWVSCVIATAIGLLKRRS